MCDLFKTKWQDAEKSKSTVLRAGHIWHIHFLCKIYEDKNKKRFESTDLPTVQHFFVYLQYGHSCCWMLCKQWTSILCFFFSFVNKVLFSIISFFFYILWSCKEVFIVQSRHDLTVQTHTEAFLKTNFNALFSFSNIISLSLASDLRIRKNIDRIL